MRIRSEQFDSLGHNVVHPDRTKKPGVVADDNTIVRRLRFPCALLTETGQRNQALQMMIIPLYGFPMCTVHYLQKLAVQNAI